jgi:hypothetical protein
MGPLMILLQRYLPTRKWIQPLTFCLETIHAFFDNDLFMTTKNVSQECQGLLWPLRHVVAGREPADLYGSSGSDGTYNIKI